MKRKEVRQQKTIIRLTPEDWDEAVNAFLATLTDDVRREPTITRERTTAGEFLATVEYFKLIQEPETIADEFYLRGEVHRCDDCPQLKRERDRRIRWLTCERGMRETTSGSSEACDWYYEQLNERRPVND